MGELVRLSRRKLGILRYRIEWKAPDYPLMVLIDDVVDAVIKAGKEAAALTEHTIALPPKRIDIPYIAVGDRMEDKVKGTIGERQRLSHVGPHQADAVSFTPSDGLLALKLELRIIKDSASGAKRGEDGHLLAAA